MGTLVAVGGKLLDDAVSSMIELNVVAIARKGMNGMIMRKRRKKMVGDSKNQKKRKKDGDVSVIFTRFVAKNWMIYDAIRKRRERKARAYFVIRRARVRPS